MTDVAWLLRPARLHAALPLLAGLALAAAAVLPAQAQAWQGGAPIGPAPAATRADEWWLTALNVPGAWRAAPAKGKGVTVAVLSTGVDGEHQDLTGTVTTGPDYSQTGRTPGGQYWGAEGTAVASLIAGHGHGAGGTDGVTGVAPDARVLSLRVTLEYDDPLTSDAAVTRRLPAAIAQGIRYAVGHGATVIALPLDPGTLGAAGGDPAAAAGSAAERAAVRYAIARDVLLVAPAGDNGAGTGAACYPAAYPGVIAVGATARDGQLSPFTNAGSYVALTAPGSVGTPQAPGAGAARGPFGLLAAAPGGGYQSLASTDMSAALTAGVAALIRGRYPLLTVTEVTRALEQGATVSPAGRLGTGKASAAKPGWGHGALDAAAALTAAGLIAAALPPAAPRLTPAPAARKAAAAAAHPAGLGTGRPAARYQPGAGAKIRSILADLVVAAGAAIAVLAVALTVARLRRPGRPARAAPAGPGRHARTPPAVHPQPRQQALATTSPPVTPARPPQGTVPPAERARRADMPLAPWEQSPAEFAHPPFTAQEPARPTSNSGPMYIWNPPDQPA